MNQIDNRQIRVFISSTFQDMQDERSELIRKTFPRLREMAAQRDVTLTEVDLRWGITKEESESGKVMEICLREVKNSIPFFIGIIGNRYGWIPSDGDVSEIVKERFPKVPGYVKRQLSATEIEMQFGALDSKENMNAFFFIKDGEEATNIDNPERLAALKQAVRENKRYPVSTYKDPEDLSGQVLVAFTKLLDGLFPVCGLSALEKERLGQRAVLNNLSRVYIKNDSNFAAIDTWMEDWEKHQLVITGESGLGKSALVAKWVKGKLESGNSLPYRIIYHFVGYGGSIGSDWHVVKALCDEIQDQYHFDAEKTSSNTMNGRDVIKDILSTSRVRFTSSKDLGELNGDTKTLEKLFKRVAADGDKPLLIVLDGINQIVNVNFVKRLNWLPIPPKRVKILFTTLADDETMQVFKVRNYPVFTLRPLTRDERIDMVREYLEKTYRKHLQDTQLKRIVDDPQNENTLVLKTLLDEVANFGIFAKLDEKIEEYLKPDSIGDFYQVVLKNYETDFGEDLVRHFLSLIAVSRNGLSEDELLDITNTKDKPLLWSQFFCSFRQHMILKNGLITFAHAFIREAVEACYIKGDKDWERSCREEIVSALEKETTFEGKKSTRSMDEVPYQLDYLGDVGRLHNYLMNLDVFSYLYKNEILVLGGYWRKLTNSGHYSLEEFLSETDRVDDKRKRFFILSLLCTFTRTTIVLPGLSLLFIEKAIPLANNDREKAEVLDSAGASMSLTNNYQKALEYTTKALDLRRLVFGKNHTKTATSYNNLGMVYRELGDPFKSLDFLEKALSIWQALFGENHPFVAVSYDNVGVAYGEIGNLGKELELTKRALEVRRRLYGDNSPEVARSYNNVGTTYVELGLYQKALDYENNALQILLKNYGENHPTVAASFNNVGITYGKLGNHQVALRYEEKALEIYRRLFGEEHLDVATSYDTVGGTYRLLGDFQNAMKCRNRALEIRKNIIGENNLIIAGSYNNVGSSYVDLGDQQKALLYLERALKIRMAILGEKHPLVENSYENLYRTYSLYGDYQKALEYGEKLLEIRRKRHGEYHSIVASTYNSIWAIYNKNGDYLKGLIYEKKALDILRHIYGEDHQFVEASYNNIGQTYCRIGDRRQELIFRLKALDIALKTKHEDFIAIYLNRIARAYKADNQLEKARNYFRQAAEKYREIGDEKQAQANWNEIDNC